MANISQSFWSGQHLDADHVEQHFFFFIRKQIQTSHEPSLWSSAAPPVWAQWLPIGLSLFIFIFLCFAFTLKKAVH